MAAKGKKQRTNAKAWAEKKEDKQFASAVELPEGKQFFDMKKAKSIVRLDVIPYVAGKGNPNADEGMLHFERTYYVHPRMGASQGTYLCPRETLGKPCPMCEFRDELRKAKGWQDDGVKSYNPKKKQLWNVIDLADADKGVQVLDVSHFKMKSGPGGFGEQLKSIIASADEGEGFENFAELKGGKTVKIVTEDDNFLGNAYKKIVGVQLKPRAKDYDEDIMEECVCFEDDGVLVETDYKKLKKILDSGSAEAEDEDEDHAPDRNGRAGKSAKAKADADDDDDQDDDEDDEDGDDKPTKAKKKAKPADDDDEDDDDSDDDDAPPKKGGKKEKTAEQLGLEVGDRVEYEGTECEIKKISKDGTSLTLEDDDENPYTAVGPEEVKQKVEADEDDEEDDDEPPKKGKGKKAKVEEDDDDDDSDEDESDDEDEDDEEDEPKTKKGSDDDDD